MDSENKEAIFMHCLPAYHDLKTKVKKDAAENRIHCIKAIILATIGV